MMNFKRKDRFFKSISKSPIDPHGDFYSPGYNRPFRLVIQEERFGCGRASLAMAFGTSYQKMKQRFYPQLDLNRELTYWYQIFSFLESQRVQTVTQLNLGFDSWLPDLEMLPPISLATVYAIPNNKYSRVSHMVVVLKSGIVLDPSGIVTQLSSYYWVDNVVGLKLQA